MSQLLEHTFFALPGDALATIRVASVASRAAVQPLIRRALQWLAYVDEVCSSSDEHSELRRLASSAAGVPVHTSLLVAEAVRFGLQVARATNGAYDPVRPVELALGRRGPSVASATYRDVTVDLASQTITLHRPLLLDLGPLARGLAMDLAARELSSLPGYRIELGEDVLAGGYDAANERWRANISRPIDLDGYLGAVRLAGEAVCTLRHGGELAVVVAPAATLAKTMTAAVLAAGPSRGLELLVEQQLEGFVAGARGSCQATPGFYSYL